MIDHIPWPNEQPTLGLDGQRIALVEYSHHRKPDEEDTPEFTRDVVRTVLEDHNRSDVRFVRALPTYFGYNPTDVDFWHHVTFFNYLPNCVGPSDERFGDGTPDQIASAKLRLLRILRNVEAKKLFIFTSRSWTLPPTREQQANRSNIPLGPDLPKFWWGTYDVGEGGAAQVFKLRHPQGASSDLMRRAVKAIMDDKFKG